MSTSFTGYYHAKEQGSKRDCAICGLEYTEYSSPMHYGPLGDKVCYWCCTRKHVYARFNKLIEALEAAVDGDKVKAEMTLNGIRKALS